MTETERLHRRNLMNNGRCVILATNDEGGVHKVQVRPTPFEIIDDVPVLQLYGFSGHAPVGSEAHLICTRGDRSSTVVVATNNPEARLRKLQPGEVGIYDDQGTTIILKRDKSVEIHAATKVRIVTPRLEVTGDIIDHCDEQAHTAKNMREIYNTHTHPNVQSGPANTGVPNQPQRETDE
jgi:phage gp45-like